MKTLRRLVLPAIAAASLLPATGAAQARFETVYQFGPYPDAQTPAGLVEGAGGVLYGASTNGGIYGYGSLFELQPPAAAGGLWTESVLYSFAPQNGDGIYPVISPIIGPGGALYGPTPEYSPTYGDVYQALPPASAGGNWTESVLFRSTSETNIIYPGNVAAGPNGVVYGVAASSTEGRGAVFELTPPDAPGGAWTETILYNFTGGADGGEPVGLSLNGNGALYGAANLGGAYNGGTVFQLTPPASPGGAWTETVLYSFATGTGGYFPNQPPVISGGAIYGATNYGGSEGFGTVYQLVAPASQNGAWTETVLYNIGSNGDGKVASSPLLIRDGNVYGTSATGVGAGNEGGTVFELQPPASPGGAWTEIVLHTFTGKEEPYGSLVMDKSGALYGTTNQGVHGIAPSGRGMVYRIRP